MNSVAGVSDVRAAIAGKNLARARKPQRVFYPITIWLFWAVDTQFAVNSVITIQRFDHERAPWTIHDFWGGACKLVGL